VPLGEAIARVESAGPLTAEVRTVVEFVRSSKRGVVLSRRRGAAGEAEP
jgi:hypothetical protein